MKSNTRFNKNIRGTECLNCNKTVSTKDNFCSNCGQVNDTTPLSLKQYVTELLGGFFAFDTRTITTLQTLLLFPGKVSREYVKGKRLKYVNPFKLYLHTSIIFFLAISVIKTIENYNDIILEKKSVKSVKKIPKKKKEKSNKYTLSLGSFGDEDEGIVDKKIIDSTEIHKKIKTNIDKLLIDKSFLALIQDTIPHKKIVNTFIVSRIETLNESIKDNYIVKNDSLKKTHYFQRQYIKKLKKELKEKHIDYVIEDDLPSNTGDMVTEMIIGKSFFNKMSNFKKCKTKNIGKALDSMKYKRSNINVFLFKKVKEYENMKNGDAFIKKYVSNISITLFLIIPLFALLFSLFYVRHKINYTEHLIFIFNVQTAFFILFLVTLGLNTLLKKPFGVVLFTAFSFYIIYKYYHVINAYKYKARKKQVLFLYLLFALFVISGMYNWHMGGFIFIIIFCIYLYKSLRVFYQQSSFKTKLKFLLLNISFLFLMIFGGAITIFLAFVS